MKMVVFRAVSPCSLVEVYRLSEVPAASNNPELSHLLSYIIISLQPHEKVKGNMTYL
jgi:hypothetical protein